ncbi:hypothetical protein HYFRA_00010913 [Hymenoscyphus fraxineus]|uniref:Uncharacterized protein n=1 Tax=Hymenoscyphus fraxineus TaxID=746836 RepID=A0A9N9KYS3_9HELO|nr:hypothetical protein HYFRA_00010913 [Hymenoscyphus fraxineus]
MAMPPVSGMRTLSGPTLSATKFGRRRPAIEDALRIDNRYEAICGEVLVFSKQGDVDGHEAKELPDAEGKVRCVGKCTLVIQWTFGRRRW